MSGRGSTCGRRAGRGVAAAIALTAFALIAAVAATSARAAQATFSAHGSVEQVYVTGLAPRARTSLLNRKGRKVATKRADSLGGVLFRHVRPGTGYRIRLGRHGPASGPLAVLSTRPAPATADVYNQSIPSSGYTYLTTRDGTKLAIYV